MLNDIKDEEKLNAPEDNIPAEVLPLKINIEDICYSSEPGTGSYP